ncbi:MAG: gamma-glutamyltransferase, partial [Alphaproteobacteria bacterium]|nr:gamma-glutamyltransferase [Alphaproteobacteria bacterium]
VEPHLNGPAGDAAILLHDAAAKRVRVVCGQGPTPAAATPDRFADLGLDLVPGTGLLAAVVPGAFDAWMLLLRDYGTLSLEAVLAPAIGYAENGYPVLPRMTSTIEAARTMFERYWPSSAAIYLPDGEPPRAGALFRNRTLAQTWRRLVTVATDASGTREDKIDAARRAWSHGFVVEAIDAFCRRQQVMDVTGQRHGALLRGDDMAAWSATYEEPAVYDYGGHRFAKCGVWSQGPVLLQTLALLAGSDIDRVPPSSAAFVHLLVEAMKLAYADRELHYGDPDHVEVPLGSLLSEEYNESRRRAIGEHASMEWRPGTLGQRLPAFDYAAATARKRDEGLLAAYGGGEPTVAAPAEDAYLAVAVGDTSHIDVVDRDGNMVSATPSGGWLQSSPTIPDLGFPLGTRAQTMWLDPPDMPSALAPGRRPRTTLSPTIVSRDDGDGLIACGTPGGDQQDQWQLAFLLRHVHHDMGLQQAIEAPGFHSEHWPNSFYPRQASSGKVVLEGRFAPAEVRELQRRGHDIVVADDWSEGRISAVAWDRAGTVRAAANPRGMQGYAVGR